MEFDKSFLKRKFKGKQKAENNDSDSDDAPIIGKKKVKPNSKNSAGPEKISEVSKEAGLQSIVHEIKRIEMEEERKRQDEENKNLRKIHEKFVQMFKGSSKLSKKEKKAVSFEKENSMLQKKELQNKVPGIPFKSGGDDKETYDRFFSAAVEDLKNRKIEEVQDEKKKVTASSNQSLKEKLDDNFDFVGTKKSKRAKDELVPTAVQIKQYKLKTEFKKKKAFCTEFFENVIVDSNAEEVWNQEGGISRSWEPHKKLQEYIKTRVQRDFDKDIFSILNGYHDFVFVNPEENYSINFRKLWIMHVINHILKAQQRSKVPQAAESPDLDSKKEGEIPEFDRSDEEESGGEKEIEFEGEKLQKKRNKKKKVEEEEPEISEEDLEIRNKGYTPCRILVLCPYKSDAFEIIKELILTFNGGNLKRVSRKSKFLDDFAAEENALDDDFKIGISFTSDSTKLYSLLKNSDIIVASPLGLRLTIGSKGEKERNFSFLSSIEICILDKAHTLYMQNWQHMLEIFPVMNKIPRHQDMSNSINHIREYFFDNLGKFFRQNIVYTEFNFPELEALRTSYFENHRGSVRNKPFYRTLFEENPNSFSVEFQKLDVDKHTEAPDRRFEFFKNRIWSKMVDDSSYKKTVIFVNSYYEFLRLRGYFKKTNSDVLFISEYTKKSQVQKRIAHFLKNDCPYLLFSERAFFFNVCKLRKMEHIIFYSIPKSTFVYEQLINSLVDPNEDSKIEGPCFRNKVMCLFTKFDALYLEKIVGTKNISNFLADYNKANKFVI